MKPRSAKQQAAAKVFSVMTFGSRTPAPKPTTSWWIGLDRQALNERARQEQARMNTGKFGRTQGALAQGD